MGQGLTKQKHMSVVVACQGVFDVLNCYFFLETAHGWFGWWWQVWWGTRLGCWFRKKLMRATQKEAKQSCKKMGLFFRNKLFFLYCFFLFFFRKSATIQCARWAEKHTRFLGGNALPESNARAHLKHREKTHSGLSLLIQRRRHLPS